MQPRMQWGRCAVTVLTFTALVRGQDPAAPRSPIAVAFAVEECPDLLGLVPADLIELSKKITAGVDVAVLRRTVAECSAASTAARAAAVVVLTHGEEARSTPSGLLAEIHACLQVRGWAQETRVRKLLDPEGGDAAWPESACEPSERRALGLATRLVRKHPDSPEAAEVVLELSSRADAALTATTAAIAALGEGAGLAQRIRYARCAMAEQQFELAGATLAKAAGLPRSGSESYRERAARDIVELNHDLQRIHALQAATAGDVGDVAALRDLAVLQLSAPERAVERARELAAQELAHALPETVLASDAIEDGTRQELLDHLQRAAAKPGGDFLFGTMSILVGLGLQGSAPRDSADADAAKESIRALLEHLDALLAEDPGEEATIYRFLREQLSFGESRAFADLSRVQPAVERLVAALPDDADVYELLLAAALHGSDTAAARRVLEREPPRALTAIPSLMRKRAAALLVLDLDEEHLDDDAGFESLLADLASAAGNDHEAAYLRGIRLWWRAAATRDRGDLARSALEQFERARTGFGESGHAMAENAIAVVGTLLGRRMDMGRLARSPYWDPHSFGVEASVPRLCMDVLDASHSAAEIKALAAMLPADVGRSARVILDSAVAAAWARLRDDAELRSACRQALQALDEPSPGRRLRHDRGVWLTGAFRHNLVAQRARARARFSLELDLWVVPPLPDERWLKERSGE